MTDSIPHATPAALLEQLDWARSLARRLVSDASTADDLVQETYVRALQSPPSATPGDTPRLRAWLGRVLTNQARQAGRASGRRARREREAARPEALPSSIDLTLAVEGQQLLIAALLRLDDAQRQLVLLRYWEGLTSAEIARRTGTPEGTVRWRLGKALDALRERLDREGDPADWRRALAPLCLQPLGLESLAPAAPTALAAVPALLFAMKWIVALPLALALVLLAARGLLSSEPADATRAGTPSARSVALDAPIESGEAASERRSATGAPATVYDEASRSDAAPLGSDDDRIAFRARFVDPNGAPVAGVRFGAATSDADGRATQLLRRTPQPNYRLTWSHPDYVSDGLDLPRPAESAVELGERRLSPGARLAGRVVDPDGAPLAGLSVEVAGVEVTSHAVGGLRMSSASSLGAANSLTDDDGRFALHGLLPGRIELAVSSHDDLYAETVRDIELRAGADNPEVTVIAPAADPRRRIEGRLLGPDGEPRGGSLVVRWNRWFTNGTQMAVAERDEDGRFRIVLPDGVKRADLELRPFDDALEPLFLEDVASGQLALDLQLARAASFRARVDFGNAEAPEEARLLVLAAGTDRVLQERTWPEADGVEDPAEPLELLLPSERFDLRVLARGFRLLQLERLDPARLGSAVLPLTLEPAAAVRGRVTGIADPTGAEAQLVPAPDGYLEVAGFPASVEQHPVDRTPCSASAEFRLFAQAPGRYFVRLVAPEHASALVGPLTVDPAVTLDLPAVELGPGGALVGRALPDLDDGGGAAAGIAARRVLASCGDGLPRVALTDVDGRYRFNHLTPGPWQLRLLRPGEADGGSARTSLRPALRSIEADCFVVAGRTTTHDLIPDPGSPPAELTLTARIAPQLGRAWRASLLPTADAESPGPEDSVAPDAAGRAELRLPHAGPAYLRLERATATADDPLAQLILVHALALPPGPTELTLVIESGTVELLGELDSELPTLLCGHDPDQDLWIQLPLTPATPTEVPFPACTTFTSGFEALLFEPSAWPRTSETQLPPDAHIQLELP